MEINDTVSPGERSRAIILREWLSKSKVKWCIAILVAIVLLTVVLVATLPSGEDSSIRLLKLWPHPNEPKNIISFVHGSSGEWREMTDQFYELFARYTAGRRPNVVHCFDGDEIESDQVCNFDIEIMHSHCSRSNNYGYDIGKPCIFLEFNKIPNWVPEPYTTRELENFVNLTNPSGVSNMVYLDCQGDTDFDQENMGIIQYTPSHGFPTKYFPYRGQAEYMSPIVGIRFTRPAVGVAISVICKLWAKNINNADNAVPSGQISFNLLVD